MAREPVKNSCQICTRPVRQESRTGSRAATRSTQPARCGAASRVTSAAAAATDSPPAADDSHAGVCGIDATTPPASVTTTMVSSTRSVMVVPKTKLLAMPIWRPSSSERITSPARAGR